ncbi:uncharacterized protein LOC113312610 [Papaver somniferum]|uniref:uncharacterized protein LOC113312610 n=1 Tax=Papaver somniferum TaxID=3469 RepID=UPI000E6FAE6D|nr:uncharacterized protein LOC113312610 [Papaver somniferum]
MEGMNLSTISEDLSTWLERDIDEKECVESMKSVGQNKSPGPYGFPEKSFIDWRLKITFIALVPKIDSIEEIKDPRPISLIHGAYKIVSEILAERFKQNFPIIISQHQTVVVKKRQILDGFLIANELIDSRLRSGKPVGKALTFMIRTAQEQGILSSFQVKGGGFLVSYLQFADDTLIFLDADIEKVKNLRLILLSFEMLTGLKINFAKSQISGVGYDGDLNVFCSLLGCHNGVSPIIYLGIPLGDKCGGVAKWDKVVDKFIARFHGWKKTLFFRAGKITLINNVFSSLPVYYMSLNNFSSTTMIFAKKERNNRVFNDSQNSAVAGNEAVYVLFTWSLAFKELEEIDSKEVMKQWCKIYFDIV